MTITIPFNLLDDARPFAPQPYRIALVVRGMTRPGVAPPMHGHADCVLSTGAPVGFLMDSAAEARTGAISTNPLEDSALRVRGWAPSSGDTSGDTVESGGDVTSTGGGGVALSTALAPVSAGAVYAYGDFLVHRPQYVSRAQAAATHTVSTLLVINVSEDEAHRFDSAWAQMRADPGMFGLVGWNCAVHAGWAFARAGLLRSAASMAVTTEIEGFDTPTQLFIQLLRGPANGRSEVLTGFLGFEPLGASGAAGHYAVTLDPPSGASDGGTTAATTAVTAS